MQKLFRITKNLFSSFLLLFFLLMSCDSRCFVNADCPSKHSCFKDKCTPWLCESNFDCDDGVRVCNKLTHVCEKCTKHEDCDKGLYCLNGICDKNNPTCSSNGFLEVCKKCENSDSCPAGLTCEKYSPDSENRICKR